MDRKKVVLTGIAAAFAAVAGFFIWKLDLPSWQKLDIEKIQSAPAATAVMDRNGEFIGNLYSTQNRRYVSLSELPEYIPQAFISAEDARFYEHCGIDVRRIFSALWHDIRTGSLEQGASTITQQLIKLTHLSGEKTLSRKAQEAYLAISLERKLSKYEILEAYLNTVYFGSGAYGIGAAAEVFFEKSASELTLGETALLAGIIKSPSGYSPFENAEDARKRREYVLNAMAENGYISKASAAGAANEQIILADRGDSDSAYSWYIDTAAQEAQEILGMDADELFSGGYVIYTGLDRTLQETASAIMEDTSVYPDTEAQGAMIAIDNVAGEIRAVVGGRDYEVMRGLNRATMARRQVGSVIKPVSTYAAAVDRHGYVPSTVVYDVQREYSGGYMPGNAGGEFNGNVTLRTALARSLNAATVDLADTIGIGVVCDYAEKFGIPVCDEDENLAFALGAMTEGATPAEVCGAYAALANGGNTVTPHAVTKICDRFGNVIYEFRTKDEDMIKPESAYIITDMLKTAAYSGTAKALGALPFPVAAKTGTAGLENGDTSDIWTAAYTTDIAVVVWMGYDSNENGGMAASVTGGGYAAPVCAKFLENAAENLSGTDFDMPEELTPIMVDGYLLESELKTVLAADNTPAQYAVREIFHSDSVPEDISDIWDAPEAVTDISVSEGPSGLPLISFICQGEMAEYMVIRETDGSGEIAGVLRGTTGEKLVFEDMSADISREILYTVIPRHRILYEEGRLVTAEKSVRVKYQTGLIGGISRLLGGDNEPEIIESHEFPLF